MGFITGGEFSDTSVMNPMSMNWMSGEKDYPERLRNEMIDNGWENGRGALCWSETFQPKPVKAKDGNVWLSMNSSMMGTAEGTSVMFEAVSLLEGVK